MNLLELSNQINCSPNELEEKLLEKDIRVFSQTFPLSDEIITMLTEEFKQATDAAAQKIQEEKKQKLQAKDILAEEMLNVMYQNTQYDLLEKCLKERYHVIIDTSSILRRPHAFERFFKECRPLLEKYDSKLLVPYAVVAELGNMICSKSKDDVTLKRAETGVELIKKEVKNGTIEVIGERDDVWKKKNGENGYFADAGFLVLMLQWRNNSESALLITQDHQMALDVMKITSVPSVKSDAVIMVKKLDHLGKLVDALEE